jgi:hypothetical protein
MTLDETADFISVGLPGWQRDTNRAWLEDIHELLNDGGIWDCPALELLFQKIPEGFEIIGGTNNDTKH